MTASSASSCSREVTFDVVQADPDKNHTPNKWDELWDEAARTHAAQVRPTKLIRMRAKQVAEELFMVRHGSLEDKEEAARRFIVTTTGEENLRQYSFVVLHGLLEAEGLLVEPESCRTFG
jgi:hypothetical protein